MSYIVDEIDKRILFELEKNARIPETSIAKKINKSKESVRYRIRRLQEENYILGYTTWIDPTKLGFQTMKIYLTLANRPNDKKEFIDYVKKDKRLFWLGIAEGVWNAGLTYFVKSPGEFFELKNDIYSKFKELILESKTATVVEIAFHEKTFLHEEKTSWKTMFNVFESIEIDTESKKVLKSLYKNSRENIASIAIDNDLTVDVVRNRMKNLEERGIIKKYMCKVNYEKLGYEFYKTFLYFKSLDIEDINHFTKFVESDKHSVHYVKSISPWDIELETYAENFSSYNKYISKITSKFSENIIKMEVAIMMEDHVYPAKEMIFE